MRNPYLGFQCCLEVGHDLWFSSFRGNGLFCWDGEKVEHILDFQEEENIKLFTDIKSYKGKLYFVPLAAARIYVYDLAGETMESIPYENRGRSAFSFSILYNHYLYMFPTYYHGILKLDMDTHKTEIIDDWIGEDFKKCQLSEDAFFRGDYVRKGDMVYLPFCNAHAVLEFCLDSGDSTIRDVGNQDYATIVDDGEWFWMAPRSRGNIVRWNPVTGERAEYRDFPEGFWQGSFLGSFYRDGYVWIFPERANMVLKVNVHTGAIAEDARFSGFCNCAISKISIWDAPFVYMKKKEGEVLLCTGKSSEVVRFCPGKKEIGRFRIKLSKEDSRHYTSVVDQYAAFRKGKRGRLLLYEAGDYALEEYIEDIGEANAGEKCGQAYMAGERIYSFAISDR